MHEFKSRFRQSKLDGLLLEKNLRNKVVEVANQEQFMDMNTRFMSYGAVEELFPMSKTENQGRCDDF